MAATQRRWVKQAQGEAGGSAGWGTVEMDWDACRVFCLSYRRTAFTCNSLSHCRGLSEYLVLLVLQYYGK